MNKDACDVMKNDMIILGRIISEADKTMTTTELARKVFCVKNDYELRKKDAFIRKWLKKWAKKGIVIEENDGKKCYYKLDLSKVTWGDGTISLKAGKGVEKIKLGFVMGIYDDGWIFVSIKPKV